MSSIQKIKAICYLLYSRKVPLEKSARIQYHSIEIQQAEISRYQRQLQVHVIVVYKSIKGNALNTHVENNQITLKRANNIQLSFFLSFQLVFQLTITPLT